MADVDQKDTYTIKDTAAMIAVKVRVLGGHTGAWIVMFEGMPIPPQPDGFVVLGVGGLLRGRDVVVMTTVTKVAAGKLFTVVHDVRETSAGGVATTPIEVKGSFGTVNTADVEETITFK
jgi:hypothetical protein